MIDAVETAVATRCGQPDRLHIQCVAVASGFAHAPSLATPVPKRFCFVISALQNASDGLLLDHGA
jgi:hypothetical protein